MKRQTATSENAIATALKDAKRAPGANNRPRDVGRFDLGACILIVVPFRRWAYRSIERQAQAWRNQQAKV
ncbi:MAG: hypothetical protein ABIQ78_03700 [Dokdonella sp.]